MTFKFSPQWLHGLGKDGEVKSLIVRDESDFVTLIMDGGYTDSPKAAREKIPHPACEFYKKLEQSDDLNEGTGTQNDNENGKLEPLLTIEEIETLRWPRLKSYAKHLESLYQCEIVTGNSKKEDILAKIKELMNADS